MCTSPNLKFDTTDAKVAFGKLTYVNPARECNPFQLKKSTPTMFGQYHYKGSSNGRPYYQWTAPTS